MSRAGQLIQNMSGDEMYESFRPAPLPPVTTLDMGEEMLRLLVESNRQLAQLESLSKMVPNVDLFLSMYIRKEALLSSQIEGTQCTLDDILDPEMDANTNLDVAEVIQYIKAVQFALKMRNNMPLCNRLLRETHAILMSGIRGGEKNPGEFRRSQNWIGPANSMLKDARFIPPNVEDMLDSMSDMEKYINEHQDYDPLVRCALIHYQFETIHPFLDGNGRIGRLLILLYLMAQNLLSKPILYVSYFLKKNQVEYYDRMNEVRRSGNYEQWVRFFLEAMSAASADAAASVEKLNALHDKNVGLLPIRNRSRNIIRMLFDYLEQHPIVDIKRTAVALGISFNTASSTILRLSELGIVQEKTNTSRNRKFVYESYLEILRQDT